MTHRHFRKSQAAAAAFNCVLQSLKKPSNDVKYDLWYLPFNNLSPYVLTLSAPSLNPV